MAIFKDRNISGKQLLGYIPEALIANLSLTTKIDHYVKVLHGHKLFYLLIYSILGNEKLSRRTLEDTFNVQLYTCVVVNNKRGNKHVREELVDSPFRLIICEAQT